MSEIAKTAKKTDVIRRFIRFLLKLDLPTTLSRRPSTGRFVLSNLMKNTRRENFGRNSLHPIRFIEIGVTFVKVLVVSLKVFVLRVPLLSPLSDDVRFEVEERTSVGFASESGLTDEDVRDVL